MNDDREQPEPARPPVASPVWMRPVSELSDEEFGQVLTARERAETATPRLQAWLFGVTLLGIVCVVAAVVVFNWSHFRAMDVTQGVDASGRAVGGAIDYTVWGVAFIAIGGALLALAGVKFDVTARTRSVLVVVGAALMIVVGAGIGLLLDPSRHDLLKHYHVGAWGRLWPDGSWGSEASFARFIHLLDACGWALAACGVALLVLMTVQRRRLARAYPEGGPG